MARRARARLSSSSTATRRAARAARSRVSAPRPGPISRIWSSGSTAAAWTIRRATRLSARKFCPSRARRRVRCLIVAGEMGRIPRERENAGGENENGRAPPFDPFRERVGRFRLQPGSPASPGEYRLPLLSSEPDGVHGSPPRGAQFSTPKVADRGSRGRSLGAGFNPAGADCEYRAPLTPRLARPALMLGDGRGGVNGG